MTSTTVPPSGQARINWKRRQRAAFWAAEAERTIWTGTWTTDHERSRVIAWLRANRINTTRVDGDSPITATRTRIAFTEIRRDEAGHAMFDGRARLVTDRRTVPLRIHFTPPTEA